MLRLTAFLVLILLSLASALELRQREAASGLLLAVDPVAEGERLLASDRLDEARLMAHFAEDTANGKHEADEARALARRIKDADTIDRQLRSFAEGAVTGEPRDLAGFLGSLSLDLFVIGDVRDLAVQGYREMTDGDGDLVILALSAVGLATTLSPHLDFAPALLKVFRRAGALTERFVKSLRKVSRDALRSGNFRQLTTVAEDFGRAARALGPAPLARVMKHVDEPADLARVSRLAEANAPAAYALTGLTSGRAVKQIARGADVGVVAKAARRGSRGAKIFAKAVMVMPNWLLVTVMIGAGLAAARMLASLLPGRRERAPGRRQRGDGVPVLTARAVAVAVRRG